jgi:6-phosphogluconolactonase (cycloisomerase 2 family)
MEIAQRMSKRFGWLLGVVVLVTIGVLVACGSNYNPSSDGLVLVGSQGSALIETFSFNPFNGHQTAIANSPTDTANQVCVLKGVPSSIVIDRAGAYAYVILNQNSSCPGSATGIQAFKINSSGTTTATGSVVGFNPGLAAVVPNTMAIDTAGKFLFVADRATTNGAGLYAPGSVSVFAIGNSGSISEVAGSPFYTSNPPIILPQAGLDIVSVAPTPTVFPAIGVNGVQNSVCSTPGLSPPSSEYLYAVDGLGNQVFQFSVDTSSGALGNPPNRTQPPSFPTDQTPAGVAVDPCDRFVYVSDSLSNKVSAYTICNGLVTQSQTLCPPVPDGSLVQVSGSPFSLSGSSNSPGPLVVDPYGNNVYVLGTLSNTISQLKISSVSGGLAPLSPATVATGSGPVSMAIRADDNWLFVSNFGSVGAGGSTVSQYAITPATGQLSVLPTIPTDNYPWGVAVK